MCTRLLSWALVLLFSGPLAAQTFRAKVVGVSGGDSIVVYDGKKQSRFHLGKETDQYGRLVARLLSSIGIQP